MLCPYVVHTVAHPDPVRIVTLVLVAIFGVHLFLVALRQH